MMVLSIESTSSNKSMDRKQLVDDIKRGIYKLPREKLSEHYFSRFFLYKHGTILLNNVTFEELVEYWYIHHTKANVANNNLIKYIKEVTDYAFDIKYLKEEHDVFSKETEQKTNECWLRFKTDLQKYLNTSWLTFEEIYNKHLYDAFLNGRWNHDLYYSTNVMLYIYSRVNSDYWKIDIEHNKDKEYEWE